MLEADSFWCMQKLLEGIQDNYTLAQPGIQMKIMALRDLMKRLDGKNREKSDRICMTCYSCHNYGYIDIYVASATRITVLGRVSFWGEGALILWLSPLASYPDPGLLFLKSRGYSPIVP